MHGPKIQGIINHACQLKIPIRSVSKKQLTKITKETNFQHLVLRCSALSFKQINKSNISLLNFPKSLFSLFIDGIGESQSFGAVCRTAFFFVN